jgi:O-antigen ligase
MWLMAAPSVLGLNGAAADSTHIVGALVVTLAVVAFAEPARLVRYLNVLLGIWVMLAPWLVAGGTSAWVWNSVVSGLAIIALSLRRGLVEDRYADWQRFIL